MTAHSVAEAKNKFSELIARAENGEEVIITRHGQPVARISGLHPEQPPKRITPETIDWLIENRVGKTVAKDNAATLVRHIRDEEPE
ncbi:MAG TPA: type II toxin-antitoxin system prevent-host-death family antitoxin [Rhizomicrobium sp.]